MTSGGERKPIMPGTTGPIWWDSDGDPWEELLDGRLRCVLDDGFDGQFGTVGHRDDVEKNWGPLIPDGPRRWELPPEPGPEVRAVRTRHGVLYVRTGERWEWAAGMTSASRRSLRSLSWSVLMAVAPLTDATSEVADRPSTDAS